MLLRQPMKAEMHPVVKAFLFRLLLLVMFCGVLRAHIVTQITMDLTLSGDKVTAQVKPDAAYMLAENRGGDDGFVPDLAWFRKLTPAEKSDLKIEAEAYLRQCLELFADDGPIDWAVSFPDFDSDHPGYMTEGDSSDVPVLVMDLTAEFPAQARKLAVEWHEPFGVGLLIRCHSGDEVLYTPLNDKRAIVSERGAGGDMEAREGGFGYWILMGFHHILPEGLDHILFVLGLFLLAPKWKPLLQQTLAFTVAHTLSLAAAVLGLIHFEPRWVEIAIAISIAWVALENLWAKKLGRGRLYLVGAFGLIHGMGFASAIADKLKEQQGALAPALVGFNLGVECGQITVLAGAFILFGWWGRRFVWIKWTGSVAIGICGLLLAAQRMFGLHIFTWM